MKKELTFGRNRMLLLLVFASGILFSGCRKDKKNPIRFSIKAYMPHTNEPVSGIKWKVSETKYEGWPTGNKYTGWDIQGATDINGEIREEFVPMRNTDYTYIISFDYSESSLPPKVDQINFDATDSRVVLRGDDNIFELRILPFMEIEFNYVNTNCFDANDLFRYKAANIDKYPGHNFNTQAWSEPTFLNGCCNFSYTSNRQAGRHVYRWEATRNGITETGTDTFLVSPGVNNTINMHW